MKRSFFAVTLMLLLLLFVSCKENEADLIETPHVATDTIADTDSTEKRELLESTETSAVVTEDAGGLHQPQNTNTAQTENSEKSGTDTEEILSYEIEIQKEMDKDGEELAAAEYPVFDSKNIHDPAISSTIDTMNEELKKEAQNTLAEDRELSLEAKKNGEKPEYYKVKNTIEDIQISMYGNRFIKIAIGALSDTQMFPRPDYYYNVYYIDTETGKNISLADILDIQNVNLCTEFERKLKDTYPNLTFQANYLAYLTMLPDWIKESSQIVLYDGHTVRYELTDQGVMLNMDDSLMGVENEDDAGGLYILFSYTKDSNYFKSDW